MHKLVHDNIRICSGCGSTLQTEDEGRVGYIHKDFLERGMCQRCFKIKQYSDFSVVDIDNQELYALFGAYIEANNPILHILDITDLLGTALFDLKVYLQNKPLIIIVNKIDVIPKSMRRYDIWYEYIRSIFNHHSINIEQIFFISAKDTLGIARVIEYLAEEHAQSSVRVIGSANVGKSSFIQAVLGEESQDKPLPCQAPLIFNQPGTTLGELKIPCEFFTLYDTPGIMQPSQFSYHVLPKMIKQIEFRKPIKARNYPFYEPQNYFIGGYASIEIIPIDTNDAGKNAITFYFNPMLPIHRRKNIEWEEFYIKHRGELLSPPSLTEIQALPELENWETSEFKLERKKTDIVISGLGWFSINKPNVLVKVHTTKNVQVYEKNALV